MPFYLIVIRVCKLIKKPKCDYSPFSASVCSIPARFLPGD